MKPNRLPLGEVLKLARKRRGLTGRAMARLAGKPSSYIHKLETGLLSPTVDTLDELCPLYEVEPWEVVAGMFKEDLVKQVLGPGPWNAAEIREVVALASRPNGLAEIRDLLEIARERPENLAGVLRVLKTMRENGMI